MTILVGYGPEARGRGGLELGRMLSLSTSEPLVVCCVIPDRWSSVGPGRQVDRDYEVYLQTVAKGALTTAEEALGPLAQVDYQVVTARSAPAGLLDAADRLEARLLVAGSSANGAWGHVALGSVTDRLVHSSLIPVILAPRGFRARSDQRVERVTVAVDGTEATHAVLARAAAEAAGMGARLRLVTFAVRHGTMYPPEVGLHIEDRVVQAWREDAEAVIEQALATLDPAQVKDVERVVAEAPTWGAALDEPGWAEGDLLVIGSSTSQSFVSRVFLGSTAARIIRHAPVPIAVVP